MLRELGDRWSFKVDVVDAVAHADGQHVSSTTIRRAIAGGDFSHRIRVWSKNETGQLAEDFNLMAERLQENIRKMREAG